MPKRQFSKLWGLKKLRLIAKHTQGIASYAPFKVYHDAEQYHQSHTRGKPRLLVRMDEKGKAYDALAWATMPRRDIRPSKFLLSRQRRVRELLRSTKYSAGPLDRDARRMQWVVHPTRPRADVHWMGTVRFDPESNKIELSIGQQGKNADSHYFRWGDQIWGGKLVHGEVRGAYDPQYDPFPSALRNNLLAFFHAGIKSKQLNPKREFYLYFNTWSDAPAVPEFYDLREFRSVQPQNKKKKK